MPLLERSCFHEVLPTSLSLTITLTLTPTLPDLNLTVFSFNSGRRSEPIIILIKINFYESQMWKAIVPNDLCSVLLAVGICWAERACLFKSPYIFQILFFYRTNKYFVKLYIFFCLIFVSVNKALLCVFLLWNIVFILCILHREMSHVFYLKFAVCLVAMICSLTGLVAWEHCVVKVIVRLAGTLVGLSSCRLPGPKSRRSFGPWAAANCAAPPSVIASQYTSLNCKTAAGHWV